MPARGKVVRRRRARPEVRLALRLLADAARPESVRVSRLFVEMDAIGRSPMGEYDVRPLAPHTWAGFEGMAKRHNGVFGGCWCTWFHTMSAEKERTYEGNRSLKRRLVDDGRAHAALVYDGDEAVAWCEYGTPEELPNIYHRKQYDEELDVLPDYRITCIFVDKRYRRRGLSGVALRGALDLIAAAGGGVVEGYPHDTKGTRKAVLYNGTRDLFERAGFEYVRSKGTGNCVMRRTVP